MTVKVNGIDHSAIKRFIIIALLLAFSCVPCASAAETKPNILLIVADDLGYGDLGCYGATRIKTPNIDRLAGSGVRFTDAHAPAAVCQPSRYAIISGTYFMRAQRKGQQTLYFHDGQVTLPGLLKSAGYRTAALGKWHLGFGRGAEPDYNAELKPGPLEVGFDSFFGCSRTHNEPPFVFVENHRVVGFDPADPIRIIAAKDTREGWGHGVSKGAQKAHAARPQERIDLILADKATQFISRKSESPFFLYLAFLAPHVPIAPATQFQGTSRAANYGDFIQQLDACVGKVLDALKAHGLADNTLVFFTSDNGGLYIREPLVAGHRPNGTLLGQKTDAWEGGHRVPFIACWPGRIPPGSRCDRLLGLTDLMATIAAVAKVPIPAGAAPDSLNQLPALIAPATAPAIRNEMLAQGTGGYALRQGDWVYLPKQGSSGFTVQVPSGPPWGLPYAKMGVTNSDIDTEGRIKPDAPRDQLYHLGNDLAQTKNLTLSQPERAEAMGGRLKELVQKPKAASPSVPPVELARDGQTAWRVFLPESAGAIERFACSELKRYVETIGGARFAETSGADAPQTIQIGLRSALHGTSDLPDSARGYDGYAISVRPERIVVAGDNPRGVLYGVYDLLERLGCHWYVQGLDPRDPEIVPRSPRPTLAAGSWAHASPIEFRICNASSLLFEIIPDRLLPQIDWAAKNRYNALSWQAHHAPGRVASEIQQMADCGGLSEIARRGLTLHGPGHCFPFFLPSEKHFDEHPEWFGLKNGKRIKHGTELPLTNFCWSNEAACDQFIRNVEAFVAKWPQLRMLYMVGIDGGGICDCPNCQARGSSDLVIDLFNRLSDRLTEVAPGVIVETVIGYGLLEKPPRAAKPNGKWRGLYAHWGRNHRQSYGDPDYAKKDNLEAWTKLFPQYTVCSYYAAASHQPFHGPPFLHAIEGDTKYLVERGASGHLTLQYPHGFWWNYSFNLAAAGQHGYYYPGRLPREQLKDYATACFGSHAGPLVEEYLATLGDNENLEASYRAGRGQATPDDMQRLRRWQGLLQDAARAAARDDIYVRRVAKLAEAMEFLLQLGPARSTVANAENVLKSYKANKAEHGEVVRAISTARARIADLEARADALSQTVPGIMDAQWMRDWTIKRTLSGPLAQVDREMKAAAAPTSASAPSEPEWKRSRPDVVVYVSKGEAYHDTDNEHFLVFSSPSGKALLATWTQSSCEGRGDNRIMVARSDDGVRWSAPKMIAGTPPGSKGNQASWGVPIVSRKGRIYCFYTRQTALTDGNPQGCGAMGCVYSDDEARTWTPGSDVPMPRNEFDNPDPDVPKNWIAWQLPTRDRKDRPIVGYTQVTSPTRLDKKVPWYAWSSRCQFMRFENIDEAPDPKDLRITWLPRDPKGLEVSHPNHDWSSCSEPSIVLLPDGGLFATMRTWTGQIWYSVSDDDGETWRPTEILRYKDGGEPVEHPLAPCPIYALRDGRYLLLFHNNDGHVGPYNQREKVWKRNYLNFLRNPAFLAVGEYRRGAHQPIWFGPPKQALDTQGVPIGPKGTTEIATYTSLTEWEGSPILWYPDRKFFLLGKRMAPILAVTANPSTNAPATRIVAGLSRIEGESSRNTQGVIDSLVDATATYGRAPGSFTIWCNFADGGKPISTFPTEILTHPKWPAETMPVIGWAPHGRDDSDGRYSNHAIINNAATPSYPAGWHHYLRTWAQAAAKYDKPVIVRLAHEMNMTWVPWAVGKHAGTAYGGAGNTFASFKEMWRTVHGIVRPIAPKVRFFWCPWDVTDPKNTGNYIQFYPGDAYVDYIGFDSYVWQGNVKRSMAEQFAPSINALCSLSPGSAGKPIIVGEFGRAPGGPEGVRVAWLRHGFHDLYTMHPRLKGLMYFDIDARFLGHPDWRLNAHPSLENTYKDLIRLPRFQGAY